MLGTQMKSVGEVMAIGRTFKEAFFKGVRSLEIGKAFASRESIDEELQRKLARPNSRTILLPAPTPLRTEWTAYPEIYRV